MCDEEPIRGGQMRMGETEDLGPSPTQGSRVWLMKCCDRGDWHWHRPGPILWVARSPAATATKRPGLGRDLCESRSESCGLTTFTHLQSHTHHPSPTHQQSHRHHHIPPVAHSIASPHCFIAAPFLLAPTFGDTSPFACPTARRVLAIILTDSRCDNLLPTATTVLLFGLTHRRIHPRLARRLIGCIHSELIPHAQPQ